MFDCVPDVVAGEVEGLEAGDLVDAARDVAEAAVGQGERHEAGGQRPREQVLVRVLTNQRSAPRPPPITAHLDPAARHAEAGQGEVAQHPAGEVRDGGREVAQLQRGHAPRPRPGGEAAPQPRQPVSVDVVAREGEAGRDHAALSRGNIFRVSKYFYISRLTWHQGTSLGPGHRWPRPGRGRTVWAESNLIIITILFLAELSYYYPSVRG